MRLLEHSKRVGIPSYSIVDRSQVVSRFQELRVEFQGFDVVAFALCKAVLFTFAAGRFELLVRLLRGKTDFGRSNSDNSDGLDYKARNRVRLAGRNK